MSRIDNMLNESHQNLIEITKSFDMSRSIQRVAETELDSSIGMNDLFQRGKYLNKSATDLDEQ